MESPWGADLHLIWENAKDRIVVGGFEKSSTRYCPWWGGARSLSDEAPFSFETQVAPNGGQEQGLFPSQGMEGTDMDSLNWKLLPLHMGDQIMEVLYFQYENQMELWENAIIYHVLLACVAWR